ncbi:probable endo-1,3(4)-beta-glucanase [Cephalotrichum gorgonifer]|uniref:Probable endo-1,3(4)-beta-glucanase n=1 Tax=Cephalotrichum gorgonifer TaxID=2041049 RepID=A0AAE8SSS1_9PEZI|nr:probable endo-1,3(4)-beta-glucanase [Cephalotrichum gorgonifer]
MAALVYLLALSQAAWAWEAPTYPGFKLIWQDNFAGAAGAMPSSENWDIVTDISVNNELQKYTTSNRNLQMSGGQTLQIVPWRENGIWTSGRLESKYTVTPEAGCLTIAEAQIRFGSNDGGSKQGMWPAFWMLGDSIRSGTGWPECGEIDILETVNGELEGFGTLHCDVFPGGVCNEPNGRGHTVSFPDQEWHTWRVTWDLQDADWRGQSIAWFRDGEQFHEVTGADIGVEGVWSSVAHSPMFFILNMAVGGNLPGDPNDSTKDGYGSMMEVGYVAHYTQ